MSDQQSQPNLSSDIAYQPILPSKVTVGVRVTFQESGEEPETFYLVGPKEANSLQRKISKASPIGSALIGRRVGEEIVAETPGGKRRIKILGIEPGILFS